MIHPIRNWLSRHHHPVSFWLHMVGIPATVLAVPLLFCRAWALAAAFFVAGYALQFIGHAIEGNRSGEEILLRRILRLDSPAPKARRKARTARNNRKTRRSPRPRQARR